MSGRVFNFSAGTRMVPEPVLAEAIVEIGKPQDICDYLVAAANNSGGVDNITVVVVKVADSWWRRLVNRWTRSVRRGHDAEAYAEV